MSPGQIIHARLNRFFEQESAGGILLVLAALSAIVLANSPLQNLYTLLIDTPVAIQIGAFNLDKPLLLWINDGLMALFFLLVGLELKREFLTGELSRPDQIVLPGMGAIGGMVVPALIYTAFNRGDEFTLTGWAIPAATDIAFALGVLSLFTKRVPLGLKMFLATLAVFDDLGAILIIAVFYTSKISMTALTIALACVAVLFILNRSGVATKSLYLAVGLVMWSALMKSGVHATLAGVVLAMFVPLNSRSEDDSSPLQTLEQDLHVSVAFVILPLFAFVNSGIDLAVVNMNSLSHPVTLGIALGLFIGKQLGVFGCCWLAIKLGWARLPEQVTYSSLYGAALLCGIGFTMSLFIGSLAFEESGVNRMFDERLGIIMGSLLSGLTGYLWLSRSLPRDEVGE